MKMNNEIQIEGDDVKFKTSMISNSMKFNGMNAQELDFKSTKSQGWMFGILRTGQRYKGIYEQRYGSFKESSFFIGINKCGMVKGFFKTMDENPTVFNAEIKYAKFDPNSMSEDWTRHQITSSYFLRFG